MRATAASLLLLSFTGFALADEYDHRLVDGEHGQLYVHGELTESACRLDMDSAWQDVELGTTSIGELRKVGDQGNPVRVTIRLEDCIATPVSVRDAWSGDLLWSPEQPAVTVSFQAPSELSNPVLAKVNGVSGLALRLTDKRHRDVRLGGEGHTLLLEPGSNLLVYDIRLQRTAAPLVVGSWHALINFRLNYD